MTMTVSFISSLEGIERRDKAQGLQEHIHAAGPECIEQAENCGRKHVKKGLKGAFIQSRAVARNVVSENKKNVRGKVLKQKVEVQSGA